MTNISEFDSTEDNRTDESSDQSGDIYKDLTDEQLTNIISYNLSLLPQQMMYLQGYDSDKENNISQMVEEAKADYPDLILSPTQSTLNLQLMLISTGEEDQINVEDSTSSPSLTSTNPIQAPIPPGGHTRGIRVDLNIPNSEYCEKIVNSSEAFPNPQQTQIDSQGNSYNKYPNDKITVKQYNELNESQNAEMSEAPSCSNAELRMNLRARDKAMIKADLLIFILHCSSCDGLGNCGTAECNRMRMSETHFKNCKYRNTCEACKQFVLITSFVDDIDDLSTLNFLWKNVDMTPNLIKLRSYLCEKIVEMELPSKEKKRIIFEDMILEARVLALKEGKIEPSDVDYIELLE